VAFGSYSPFDDFEEAELEAVMGSSPLLWSHRPLSRRDCHGNPPRPPRAFAKSEGRMQNAGLKRFQALPKLLHGYCTAIAQPLHSYCKALPKLFTLSPRAGAKPPSDRESARCTVTWRKASENWSLARRIRVSAYESVAFVCAGTAQSCSRPS